MINKRGWFVVVALCGLFCCLLSAQARDNGQWENSDPGIRQWYRSLMRPDVPESPCCGEADAYWADSFEADKATGQYIVTITDERDDAPLGRPHIPPGTRVLIPNEKIKWDQGNPTGHGVLFIGMTGMIFCFVPGGGV